GESPLPIIDGHRHGLLGQIDACNLLLQAPDADGAKHVVEGDPDLTQIRFIVAHADAVIAVPINQGDLRRFRPVSEFIQHAGCADRTPESRKPTSQHYDLLCTHIVDPSHGITTVFTGPLCGLARRSGRPVSTLVVILESDALQVFPRWTLHRSRADSVFALQ